MPEAITFFQIYNSADINFESCLTIYRISFPEPEKQTETVIRQRIDNGRSLMFAGKANELIVCMCLIFDFVHSPFMLLDYFAVNPEARGAGRGTKFMAFLTEHLIVKGRFLVMEVEHPSFGNNVAERKARIKFYERSGASILQDTRYLLPPLKQQYEPVEMQLMFLPQPVKKFSDPEIKDLIVTIYREVYNRPGSDPVLLSFLK
jgi:GNAT superfamily N-acetyltransferase